MGIEPTSLLLLRAFLPYWTTGSFFANGRTRTSGLSPLQGDRSPDWATSAYKVHPLIRFTLAGRRKHGSTITKMVSLSHTETSMVEPAGLEPATYCLQGSRSLQLELWPHKFGLFMYWWSRQPPSNFLSPAATLGLLVRAKGLEPLPHRDGNLNPARLPVTPRPEIEGLRSANRTFVDCWNFCFSNSYGLYYTEKLHNWNLWRLASLFIRVSWLTTKLGFKFFLTSGCPGGARTHDIQIASNMFSHSL